MNQDRIEIYTQPEENTTSKDQDLNKSIKNKLENLIENHPRIPESDEKDINESKKETTSNKSKELFKKAKEFIEHASGTSSEEEQEEQEENKPILDHDGLEIPQGKIPVDSQFSTPELIKLVEVAKDQGIIKEEIDVKVLEHGELGDRIRVADPREKPNETKEDKDEQ
ncbi:unnamed protein product [Candida verbasci]|uniref:Uncharacterized protein n=1 Tax=Candida verbasci TaxID=1227364 RepID=A0A9W4XL02_9ASCO|nr:unnamed protein product [Candida verbasci]